MQVDLPRWMNGRNEVGSGRNITDVTTVAADRRVGTFTIGRRSVMTDAYEVGYASLQVVNEDIPLPVGITGRQVAGFALENDESSIGAYVRQGVVEVIRTVRDYTDGLR